jgi:hypothetical protein
MLCLIMHIHLDQSYLIHTSIIELLFPISPYHLLELIYPSLFIFYNADVQAIAFVSFPLDSVSLI